MARKTTKKRTPVRRACMAQAGNYSLVDAEAGPTETISPGDSPAAGAAGKKPPPTESPDDRRRLSGAYLIKLSRIRPDPNQPRRRLDTDAQDELNASVASIGILQPITVRLVESENIYQIIIGERRYHAARAAKLDEIPCWVRSPDEIQTLIHQIVENWQRLDIHPYDLADALARLRDAGGYTHRELAQETGKSDAEISKFLALLDLDPVAQKLAREDPTGRLTRRHLYAVHALPAQDQRTLIRQIQEQGITAEETERVASDLAAKAAGRRRRGGPVRHNRFSTSHAMVTITFRKKEVTPQDVIAALDEARRQVSEASG